MELAGEEEFRRASEAVEGLLLIKPSLEAQECHEWQAAPKPAARLNRAERAARAPCRAPTSELRGLDWGWRASIGQPSPH